MTASTRIEILSCPRPLHIDRTLPSFLLDHLKPSEWKDFCNDVDSILHPLDVSLEVCQIIFFGSIMMCALGIVGILFLSSRLEGALCFLIASIIFFLLSNFVCALYLRFRLNITHGALEQLCHTMTNRKATSLSFHLRANPIDFFKRGAEGGYGQISSNTYLKVFVRYAPPPSPVPIGGAGSGGSYGGGDHFSALSMSSSHHHNRPSVDTVAFSVKQRLEELEKNRRKMSDLEYRDKRGEILDAV